MSLRRRLSSLALATILLAGPGAAQPFHRSVDAIVLTAGADTVAMPFAGGINTPQHQFADIDGDGDLDLFLYDADLTGTFSFFRNTGTRVAPAFRLEPHAIAFPPFQTWFRLVDLDGDGLLDLATDDSLSGIRRYRNTGSPGAPVFTLVAPTMTDTAGIAINAGFGNVPAFADIDGDGRVDFFSNNGVDGSINYYRNVGTPSAPAFAFITSSFQGIVVLGDQCTTPGAAAAKSALHGSGALCFADIDANGTNDLLHGDQFFTGLFYLENSGSPGSPHLTCTTNIYPPAQPVSTFGFNQPTLVDIDGDGDLDLFVGALNDMFRHGFWFYRNDGDSLAPSFTLVTRDYLSLFDAGRDAVPAAADVDGDGLTDLVLGNVNGELWLLRNTGSETAPSFDLADTLFAGIRGGSAFAPAFADIQGTGAPDLFLGRFDGKVLRYRNVSGAYVLADSVAGAQYASPAAADLDGDGDVDLLVGRGNGRVSYFRNDGGPGAFLPVLVSSFYDSIDVGDNAHPALVFDRERRVFDLYIGNAEGGIALYRNEGDSTAADFRLSTPAYGGIDPLRDAAPAFTDIDGDGDLDLFVGTLKGGLHFYRNDITAGVAPAPTLPAGRLLVTNYPNPFNPSTTVRVEIPARAGGGETVDCAVFDLAGRRVATLLTGRLLPGTYDATWDARGNASGTYYCRLVTAGGQAVTKMLLIR